MSELGTRLKTAREEKGYSLDELQKITKIQKRYLTAIEEGDFSRLPGEFYGRAFVKSYSEAVGLNPDMIFEEHRDELPQPKREPVELPPRVNRSKTKTVANNSKAGSLLPTLVAVLFIIAIGLAIWLFRQGDTDNSAGVPREDQQGSPQIEITDSDVNNDNNSDNEAGLNNSDGENNNNQTDEGNEEEANEQEANEEEDEQSLTFQESSGNTYTYSLSGTDNFDISMEFSGDSWLMITDSDGEELHEQSHTEGDEFSADVTGESEITFNMGNTRTAEIYVNGELLEYESNDHRQYVIIQHEE
ncbi:helix-turn-helix domain-containing protein [Salipaludibacillus aurantiacus]|uniref:Protein RodZ, contains Xre-like HTH and DUF4115 domains n=1 Tax=Salipaludibacillus aurantiacus TaxID=1601833 RepID=A0A1H9QFY6_9BACI|nr:helix-turn-helix domain-containing protein [Salipaludibacillus aurantiacus]SER59327.1 protein RodZ, contains Xre-like HTH and DUF4115 domains [Salipaludibacillus aurantiacus]